MTALIGSVVWACLAGIAIALVVAAAVALIVRLQRPAAATRCALWFVALAVCAAAPLAIVGTMVVRGADHAAGAASIAPPFAADASHDVTTANDGTAPPVRPAGSAHAALHAFAGAAQTLRRPPPLTRTIAFAIVAAWALGALGGLTGLGLSLVRVQALKKRSSPLDGALADDLPWLTETAGREIYLRLSYEIETPIAIGFRRPVILIPTDMATLEGLRAIEPLVLHEYAHLTHYDDWSNLAQRLIERIVWFNPLVWIVGRRIALEREVAADDAVIARTNDAKQYASTLWRMAREMRMPEHVVVAPGAMLTRKQISIRIERLLDDTRTRRPQLGIALVALAIGACSVAAVAATAPPIMYAPPASSTDVAQSETPIDAQPTPAPAPRPPALLAMIAPHAAPPGDVTREMVAGCRNCDFSNRDLSNLDLSRLPITGATFDGANLSRTDFTGAVLINVSFRNANLSSDDFTNAKIIASRFDGAIFQGADFSNARFYGSTFDIAELTSKGMMHAMLSACAGCNFQNADLHGQDLRGASLEGSNLQGADLHGADLRGSRLVGSNLTNVDLDHADLSGASLEGANLTGASMDGTVTTNTDLKGATLPQ